MTEEKKGIEQSLELLDGLKVLGVAISSVLKDGKINMSDLPILIGMLNDFNTLFKAVEGINKLPDEIKDIDQTELMQLGTKAYEVVKDIIDATK